MGDALLSALSRTYALLNRTSRLVVVTFHRVEGESNIRRRHIRHHLRFLARHYQTVTPSQFDVDGPPSRAALVTIDDCHADVYEHIFPIARSLDVPITIAVPTDFFFRRAWLWFDRLDWVVRNLTGASGVDFRGERYDLRDTVSLGRLRAVLKQLLPEDREELFLAVQTQLGLSIPESPTGAYRPVSIKEMTEMLSGGLVELCAHTTSHTIATVLPNERLHRELVESKNELESFCNRPIRSFCYPNGEEGDFDHRTREVVARVGHRMAFTSIEGTNHPGSMDPLVLRRVHAHPRTAVFEKLSCGLGDVQKKLKRRAPPEDQGATLEEIAVTGDDDQ